MKITKIFVPQMENKLELPLYQSKVQAGFPSPADDYMESALDLNKHLIKHPASTFFVRVTGDSMIESGIRENDLLVVDRSLEPGHNKIVIASVNGGFTVKTLKIRDNDGYLVSENTNYPAIKLDKEATIWGVVTAVIHQF